MVIAHAHYDDGHRDDHYDGESRDCNDGIERSSSGQDWGGLCGGDGSRGRTRSGWR